MGWGTPSILNNPYRTSALVAILQDEPERHAFNEAIEAAEPRLLSVANWVETSIVIEVRYGTAGLHLLDRFLDRAAIECVPERGLETLIMRNMMRAPWGWASAT